MTATSSPDKPVTEDALSLAQKVLRKVVSDVERAIAVRSLYARCADQADIIESYGNTWEGYGFETVRNSLLVELIVILMRIYDKADENTASLRSLSRQLSNVQNQPQLRNDALRRIETLKGDHRLRSLRKLRNEDLAHSAMEYSRSPPARYGYAEALLDDTIVVVYELATALIGPDYDFEELKDKWARYAEAFWIRASIGERQTIEW